MTLEVVVAGSVVILGLLLVLESLSTWIRILMLRLESLSTQTRILILRIEY